MKPEKTNKLALRVEKRSSFKTKRGIKIRKYGFVDKPSGNNLAKFQPNWSSSCRLDLELKTYLQLAKISLSTKKKGKCIFCGVLPVLGFLTPKCPVSSILIDTRGISFQTIEL